MNNDQLSYKPVGFIDDNALLTGKKLMGYSVLGTAKEMHHLLHKHPIDGILISFQHTNDQIQTFIKTCKENDIYVKQFNIHLKSL
ncbi:MAG: hypothetical protein OMM_07064 [Candidatus Magnetoglobus multicellularis str. Araruama]|uniref:Response regulatory domain-containing protein n=1 Tax=Candidatus Magnetoglobus multicellularis str. Araruama TaxID=890399 RepID=A0A1V1PEP6_9BACT|nr:MAG: hypothetical protein OMM_07064 [Candidatus Magnetoglobus multicellularis str. Araruama]